MGITRVSGWRDVKDSNLRNSKPVLRFSKPLHSATLPTSRIGQIMLACEKLCAVLRSVRSGHYEEKHHVVRIWNR